jgi:glutamate synthase domain-containing protein 2/glutamate synthase domain-containing protein 1/glutamate synthase domain-containing protein 3
MRGPDADRAARVVERFVAHPGRGGCGVGAIARLAGGASHELVSRALAALGCLEHRGGSIDDTGDGAGLLLTTDARYFERFIAPGRHLPEGHRLVVGVLFFPIGETPNVPHWQREIDAVLRRGGLQPLGWRHVPVDDGALGGQARAARRDVWQVLVGEGMVRAEDLPLVLWRTKAELERRIHDLFVVSLSARTLVYKALASGAQLRRFYPDLADEALRASAVVFHRRYSTNTFSNWTLAQPFRTLCHNGEINTIKANRNAVENLEAELGLGAVLMPQGSDSADLDRVVELFVSHGVSLLETLCRMMPMAWRDRPGLGPESVRLLSGVERALGALGAWEGPAAVVATDGAWLVGALDRMGLRPLRWLVTDDGLCVVASEIGAVEVPLGSIVEAGQLDPGEILALDLATGRLLRPADVLASVTAETAINFGQLADDRIVRLTPTLAPPPPVALGVEPPRAPAADLRPALALFGWTAERVRVVKHLAQHGKEPITSMGYDRPLAALSALRPPLTKYFKQIVAVVTNPPIDPIREGGAFDLTVHLGAAPAVHEERPVYDPLPQYRLASPFVTEEERDRIVQRDEPRALVLDATFEDPDGGAVAGAKAISRRIAELAREGALRVRRGEASILVLSDRGALEGARLPLPMVLVTSAVHNALVAAGLRRRAGLLVETGEIQEGHDAAVLVANGADALHPYLLLGVGVAHGTLANLVAGLDETLKRIMSKMGICSLDGYRGSRLFEAVGVAPAVVEHYLPGVASRLGGIELDDVYEDIRARRAQASPAEADQNVYRKQVWNELQTVARGHDPEAWGRFLALLDETPPVYLRDLLALRPAAHPLSIEAVAGDAEIVAAVFRGAAMSHGALHRVAHRAIAAAFNAFGAASNCGEGGEDPRRDRGGPWESSRSRIRQVASGRFGVDARYLAHADELQIKIGQGAKPGEGGMLPAAKVTAEVAAIRRTQVGVTLISPPPHHDIYSIEDLAQLVYDLKQVSPAARVSVKIPAVTDIGTIAVGIAKAGADVIDVSGAEGGTGAASASSIEHAGLPLERALSETHQALLVNGVRDRVRLRADGGIKTGYDVAAILALGADEVSLGTALMIAEQCIFCHGCANGLCPAGITTQDDLVARRLMTVKKGRPKDSELSDAEEERFEDAKNGVMRYLRALAGDVRRQLARVGLRRPSELTGRVDLLARRPGAGGPRAAKLDLAELLVRPNGAARRPRARLPEDPTSTLNGRIVDDARAGRPLRYEVASTDRAVGATLAGRIALGELAPPPGGYRLELCGAAGQALGFACTAGMEVVLEGFANDSVAEAMGGGTVVVRLPRAIAPERRGELSACGNAAAYGATGGRLFVEGRAGQRVGVRNSGATLVVEGAGKYAFEYMTGGVGVVLGPVGPVLGSGMTGGVVYLVADGELAARLHADVGLVPLEPADRALVRELCAEHARLTGSARAARLGPEDFVKVVPREAALRAHSSPPPDEALAPPRAGAAASA